jgi:hypothetical protein
MVEVQFPAGATDFSVLHSVQDRLWGYQAFYSISTGIVSLGVKRPVREADSSLTCSAEIKNDEAIL